MYELKKIWKIFTSKFVRTGPSLYEKRIYRAAVSQRLRNTVIRERKGKLFTKILRQCNSARTITHVKLASTQRVIYMSVTTATVFLAIKQTHRNAGTEDRLLVPGTANFPDLRNKEKQDKCLHFGWRHNDLAPPYTCTDGPMTKEDRQALRKQIRSLKVLKLQGDALIMCLDGRYVTQTQTLARTNRASATKMTQVQTLAPTNQTPAMRMIQITRLEGKKLKNQQTYLSLAWDHTKNVTTHTTTHLLYILSSQFQKSKLLHYYATMQDLHRKSVYSFPLLTAWRCYRWNPSMIKMNALLPDLFTSWSPNWLVSSA